MGCCLVALIGMIAPRILLLFLWVFTNSPAVFQGWFWPLAGFLLMPLTTLLLLFLRVYGNGTISGDYPILAVILLLAAIYLDLDLSWRAVKPIKEEHSKKENNKKEKRKKSQS